MSAASSQQVDVLIVGGGIAGLWTLSRLVAEGYHAILLEQSALGTGQTIASQGIIHGGIKYTLGLAEPGDASRAIAEMPGVWRACLEGRGEVDLRAARVLTGHQHLWTTPGLASRIAGFGASKAIRTPVEKLDIDRRPEVLRGGRQGLFRGIEVYRVDEPVLDIPSVLHALAAPLHDRIIRVQPCPGVRYEISEPEGSGQVRSIRRVEILTPGRAWTFTPRRLLFTAGAGNEQLISLLGTGAGAQRRPLHMVMVRWPRDRGPGQLFGHCLGSSTVPRLTISSAADRQGRLVWYIGGQIAESGVRRSESEQVRFALEELKSCLGWLDFAQAELSTLRVDRAEPSTPTGERPTGPELIEWLNLMVAWPTKLAFAPALAAKVLGSLSGAGIQPSPEGSGWTRPHDLSHASVAESPWDEPARRWVSGVVQ